MALQITKQAYEAIFKHCIPTGMECKHCGGNYVSIAEIESGDEVEAIDLQCSKCMKTHAKIDIVKDIK
jgi:hypothetical protein